MCENALALVPYSYFSLVLEANYAILASPLVAGRPWLRWQQQQQQQCF